MAARRRLSTSAVAWLATITATAAVADVVEILREPSDRGGGQRPHRHDDSGTARTAISAPS